MVDTTIKDVAEVAAITMRIARATGGIIGVVVASEVEVEVEGTMMNVTISEIKKGTGAHHRDQDACRGVPPAKAEYDREIYRHRQSR